MAIGMKLQAMALVGLFLPIAILAAPSADPASAPAHKAPKKAARPVVGDTSPEAIGLTKRTNVNCYIVNVDNYANCRSGPGTGYDITGAVYEGDLYTFQCYEPGECFDGNCTWDRIYDSKGGYCYVNGYFTDDNCTPANLGLC